jgi:succinate dehydrogenase / fumarate reductase flavoprotein subunit
MAHDAPAIIHMLDRMGVMFNRTPEGNLDFRRFGGTLYHRTAFAGATTGQQLLYALDEQVRRHEDSGRVRKHEFWEYLGMVRHGGRCAGIVAADLHTMAVHTFPADAVVLAVGGPGLVFGRSTNSTANTGSAAASAYREGAHYANGEFIQVHPTAIPGADKLRLMSESARGEGGRVWVPRAKGDSRTAGEIPEAERWYFLEEKYPRYGNLVPRDIGARELYDVCVNQEMGVGGELMVYLDVSHIPRQELDRKLGGILEIYETFVGEDPRDVPMKIFPAVHYSMGGLWCDYESTGDGLLDLESPRNHSTNIPGLYAIGECEYQYHGANRLGANALLSCIFSGRVGGPAAVRHVQGMERREVPESAYREAQSHWDERLRTIRGMQGAENPYDLHRELGEVMTRNVTIVRENRRLEETDSKIQELMQRWRSLHALDSGGWANQPVMFVNQLWNMLELARVITLGALRRDESRGAHYKPEFPDRDDESWLKSTIAAWSERGPELSYQDVDISLLEPVARHYD